MATEVRLRETDRLEFFSDAVIAIAATLLTVDLRPPRADTTSGASLVAALSGEWPSFFAFGLSFIFIGVAWAAHHDMFNYIQRTNHILLIINLFFLLGIALQPFSTALLAGHIDKPSARTAALIYYGVLLETSIAYNAIWWYAVSSHLVPAETDWHLIRALSWEHAQLMAKSSQVEGSRMMAMKPRCWPPRNEYDPTMVLSEILEMKV